MPDDATQKEHAANIRAERHIMKSLGVTRTQARQKLHDFRAEQAQARAQAKQAQPPNVAPPPPPKIDVDVTRFDPKPLTLADSSGPAQKPGGGPQSASPSGFTGGIAVCVDDGMGGFTQKTANYINGILNDVT